MTDVKIREAKPKELPRVYDIEREAYPAPWTWKFLNSVLESKRTTFLVAEADQKVVGYVIGQLEASNQRRVGHILNLAVDKAYRKQGIGTLLLDAVESEFTENDGKLAYLEVRITNTGAQRLYSKLGYIFLRRIENYYGDEDALVMTKVLNSSPSGTWI